MSPFVGKVAVVSGAASGIGRALCEALCAQGAVVYAADIRRDELLKVEREAKGMGSVRAVLLDVTNHGDFARALSRVLEEQGRLDLVFNNAGIGVVGDFRRIDLADMRRIVDVNLWGVVFGTKAAYDIMTRQGCGHIVNIASSAGVMPVPMQSVYAMTKHAVVGLSRSLRAEAATYGVNVSIVLPGLVRTSFFRDAKVVGDYDYEREMRELPIRSITPQNASEYILAGVRANREIIAFPASNRLVLWLFRCFPRLMAPLLAKATLRSLEP